MDIQPHRSQNPLILSIIFAALVISGSLVFVASRWQGSPGSGDADLAALLAEYKKSQEADLPIHDIDVSLAAAADDDAFLGDKDAPVTLVEFTDYQCPYCQRHFVQTLSRLKSEFIDSGKLRYVLRDFPLSGHKDALPAAIAAECAREQKGDVGYFDFHRLIFAGEMSGVGIPSERLKQYATEMGLRRATFDRCLSEEKYKTEVMKDLADGSSYGINGTPGFILSNGKTSKRISGAQNFDFFKAEIEALLE